MKIKILKNNEHCIGEWQDGYIRTGCVGLKDCKHLLDHSSHNYIAQTEGVNCLTKAVCENEPFFCSISYLLGPSLVDQVTCVARLVRDGDFFKVVQDTMLSGDRMIRNDGDKAILSAYHPTSISYIPKFDCCLMTSDGLICLEEDSYIGYQDGHIQELSAQELLDQLAKYKVERSPRYRSVTIEPHKTRPPKPRRGTVIINEVTGKLEAFIGNQWKTIKFED